MRDVLISMFYNSIFISIFKLELSYIHNCEILIGLVEGSMKNKKGEVESFN